ncbi:MAG: sensor histidine kinase [Dehalococcoidia bacterium]
MASDAERVLGVSLHSEGWLHRKTNSRLFWKYFRIFMVLVGGALLTSGGIDLLFSYQDQRQALAKVERQRAASAAVMIERFIEGIQQNLQDVARKPQPDGSDQLSQRRSNYAVFLKHTPAVTDIAYIDSEGKEQLRVSRISVDLIGLGADYSGASEFQEAKTRKTYYSPVYFRNGSEPYLTIAVAEQGSNAGVVVAEVNLKFIWDVVSEIRVGKSGHAYVVDSHGILVSHPDIGLVLQKTSLSSLPQVQEALIASTQPMNQKPPEVKIARDIQGNRVLSSYLPIRTLRWQVFVEQPLGEAFAPLIFSLLRTGLLMIIGFALAVVASMFMARKMVTPIRALQASAARIGAGALDQSIKVDTGDELEELAEEFNRMSAQLRDSYTNLEQRVIERTAELTTALDKLEEASRHKSEFLANMSHELRTPLNAIIGYSEMLEEQAEDLRQEDFIPDLHNVQASGKHLLELVNEILDFSKVEAGKMELYLETFDVPTMVKDVVTVIQPLAEKNGNTLEVRCESNVGFMRADLTKVRQTLFNLLSNASKFTQGGAISLDVIREGGAGEDQIRFSVTDTGIGMTPDQMDKLFLPFSQADSSTTRRYGGTGLGLILSRSFCQMMGGHITLASEAGKGSTFRFTLPVEVVESEVEWEALEQLGSEVSA